MIHLLRKSISFSIPSSIDGLCFSLQVPYVVLIKFLLPPPSVLALIYNIWNITLVPLLSKYSLLGSFKIFFISGNFLFLVRNVGSVFEVGKTLSSPSLYPTYRTTFAIKIIFVQMSFLSPRLHLQHVYKCCVIKYILLFYIVSKISKHLIWCKNSLLTLLLKMLDQLMSISGSTVVDFRPQF